MRLLDRIRRNEIAMIDDQIAELEERIAELRRLRARKLGKLDRS